MKKLLILLLSFVTLVSFTRCNHSAHPKAEELCSNAATRGKIISSLMNNNAYINEMMDSMKEKHPDVIFSNFFSIMKNDSAMQKNMMTNIMSICSSDSSMYQMMMGKTMDMTDADQSKCNMMMNSIQSHPNVKKAAQKSMCGMKGM